jgi:hypothetical protein
MLDAYLNEKNSEQLIKDAIKIAKPYFFGQLRTRLDEEARRVFDGFYTEGTCDDVLFYYLMNTNHPELQTNPLTQKMINFNENSDRDKYWDALSPVESERFQMKKFISMVGTNYKIDPNSTLAD